MARTVSDGAAPRHAGRHHLVLVVIALVTARTLQGAFSALLAAKGQRGAVFGIYDSVVGSGGAVGLLLGGVLGVVDIALIAALHGAGLHTGDAVGAVLLYRVIALKIIITLS